ncbi:keratin-associated protein 5-2-like [Anolis sagrei]|uniref:keratin-associated protein 5-2-like n=1 Tax=Anolis sagrei TaxID=38937 RepID=UPI0035214BFC
MCERRIYAAGREPYFNLNSTWYDPAGSWLDTRRKPFHYTVNTSCVPCCNKNNNCDVPRRGGHNYRCYGYRQSTCIPECNPRLPCGFRNPSGGPRDYWGRPIGDSCDGRTGGHYSNEESVNGSCCGASGGCGGGGGACAQPSSQIGGCGGGVCSEPGCQSGRCGGRRRGLCSEPGCGLFGRRRSVCSEASRGCQPCGPQTSFSGGCGGRGLCSEPGCGISRRRQSVCSETWSRSSRGCQPCGTGGCAGPQTSFSGGCGGRGLCSEPGCGIARRRQSVCSETWSRSSRGCQPCGRGACAGPQSSVSGGCRGRGVCSEP